MKPLQRMYRWFHRLGSDSSFLRSIKTVEGVVAKVLSILMVGVILIATLDLVNFLIREILAEPVGFFGTTLFQIFGLFLNVLIALEILENITAYFRNHVIQVELVISTSLIAVARKIIIIDLQKASGIDLIGLAIAVFALSLSYWIIRRTNRQPNSY
jgi:uncharacterized membrane protein (DUF373 family)